MHAIHLLTVMLQTESVSTTATLSSSSKLRKVRQHKREAQEPTPYATSGVFVRCHYQFMTKKTKCMMANYGIYGCVMGRKCEDVMNYFHLPANPNPDEHVDFDIMDRVTHSNHREFHTAHVSFPLRSFTDEDATFWPTWPAYLLQQYRVDPVAFHQQIQEWHAMGRPTNYMIAFPHHWQMHLIRFGAPPTTNAVFVTTVTSDEIWSPVIRVVCANSHMVQKSTTSVCDQVGETNQADKENCLRSRNTCTTAECVHGSGCYVNPHNDQQEEKHKQHNVTGRAGDGVYGNGLCANHHTDQQDRKSGTCQDLYGEKENVHKDSSQDDASGYVEDTSEVDMSTDEEEQVVPFSPDMEFVELLQACYLSAGAKVREEV